MTTATDTAGTKSCGLLVPDGAAAAEKHTQGWTFVGIGSDSSLLATDLTAELTRIGQEVSHD
jgi:4-hydroxy-2-oxoheptanedioate aldolase